MRNLIDFTTGVCVIAFLYVIFRYIQTEYLSHTQFNDFIAAFYIPASVRVFSSLLFGYWAAAGIALGLFLDIGCDHYGISIYERRRFDEVEDCQMHLHLWFHCPPDLLDVIRLFVDGGSDQRTDRHFSKAHKGTFGYLTKCHASMEPSTAKRLRHRPYYRYYNRKAGDFIKGRRFHLTTPLLRIVDLPYPPSIRVMPKQIYSRNFKNAV